MSQCFNPWKHCDPSAKFDRFEECRLHRVVKHFDHSKHFKSIDPS